MSHLSDILNWLKINTLVRVMKHFRDIHPQMEYLTED